MTTNQKNKIIKHITKNHSIGDQEKSIKMNVDHDFEDWVNTTINKQLEKMKELEQKEGSETSTATPKKRRRSSIEISEHVPPKETKSSTVSLETGPVECDSSSVLNDALLTCSELQLDYSDDTHVKKKKKKNKSKPQNRFACGHCHLPARFKTSLIAHSKKKHPKLKVNIYPLATRDFFEGFICLHCACLALNEYNLKVHWSSTHKNDGLYYRYGKVTVRTDLEYKCFWCEEHSDIFSLGEHCRKIHPSQRFQIVTITMHDYRCSDCDLMFKSMDLLKRHFSMNHPSKPLSYTAIPYPKPLSGVPPPNTEEISKSQDTNPIIYECSKCQFTSDMYHSVVQHLNSHFLMYFCPECKITFPSTKAIHDHMDSKHPGSSVKPDLLEGNSNDIEDAKRNIVITLTSGDRRKMTDKEIEDCEKEHFIKLNTEMFTYELLEDTNIKLPRLKATARKSTGSVNRQANQLGLQKKHPIESSKISNDSQQMFNLDVRVSSDEDTLYHT